MYHKITLAGYVGREPEMRYLSDGTAVTTFSMAISDGWGDKKKTIWVRATVWGKRAESANEYIKKGQSILVEGKLTADADGNPKTFVNKQGVTVSSFEVNVSDFVFTGKANGPGGNQDEPARNFIDAVGEDEVPF